MKILNLFNMYFFFLIIIQGMVTLLIDYVGFKKTGMEDAKSQAYIIGLSIMVIGVVLCILRKIFYKY